MLFCYDIEELIAPINPVSPASGAVTRGVQAYPPSEWGCRLVSGHSGLQAGLASAWPPDKERHSPCGV